jgi:hypothetical protein
MARSLSNRLDHDIGERGGGLAELPPAANVRLHESGASAVHERDHRDAVGDGVTVGLVEALEPAAIAALLARPLDQDVECGIGEAPSFVRLVDWKSRRRKYSGSA